MQNIMVKCTLALKDKTDLRFSKIPAWRTLCGIVQNVKVFGRILFRLGLSKSNQRCTYNGLQHVAKRKILVRYLFKVFWSIDRFAERALRFNSDCVRNALFTNKY